MSIALENISFRYPGSQEYVLEGIHLQVPPGHKLAVVGPSGRGKSTLLAVAGLLVAPTSGTVLIDGRLVQQRDTEALLGGTVSWVLQTVSLMPRRSVIDNVLIPLLAQGVGRVEAEERAYCQLERVGLADKSWREVRSLSGGEAGRAGVARALVTEPSVVLADEPTASLDRHTALRVAEALFQELPGTSVLITTHDREIAALADGIFDLDEQTQVAKVRDRFPNTMRGFVP